MITLALAQMVYFFCVQAPFTHGEDGIQAVPRGRLFGLIDLSDVRAMYAMVFVIFISGFLLIYRIIHSPFGQVLKAIRENEARANSLGYDTDRYKLLAYVLSAALSGLAGATNAMVFQLAALNAVHWTMSGEVVLMTLVGGLGTVFGPVVGALVVLAMENYLAQLGAWVTIAQGVIFVVCVLTFRRGIVGELGRFLKKPLIGPTAPTLWSAVSSDRRHAVKWRPFQSEFHRQSGSMHEGSGNGQARDRPVRQGARQVRRQRRRDRQRQDDDESRSARSRSSRRCA